MAHGTRIAFNREALRSTFRSPYKTNFHKIVEHGDGFIDVLTSAVQDVTAPLGQDGAAPWGWAYEYEIVLDHYSSVDPAFMYVDSFFVENYLVPTVGVGPNTRPTWVIFGVIPRGLVRLGPPLPDALYLEAAE